MTVAEYMTLRCQCGATRAEHAHAYDPSSKVVRVIGIYTDCQAFTWEIERELGGDPTRNKHLAPLMREGD
jgi:hypothetical protein